MPGEAETTAIGPRVEFRPWVSSALLAAQRPAMAGARGCAGLRRTNGRRSDHGGGAGLDGGGPADRLGRRCGHDGFASGLDLELPRLRGLHAVNVHIIAPRPTVILVQSFPILYAA